MLEKNVKNRNQVEIICIEDLVPQEHLLRKIERAVDFKKIYEFVEDLYCADNSRPSIDPVIIDEAQKIGVDGFLTKPMFVSNVIEEFERVAKRNNMALYKEKRRADIKDKRILMAEDIQINAEIIKALMQAQGTQIDHAENGKIAVEMFQDSEIGYYDAILMDVRMPEMDGLEATRKIRETDRPDASTVPIIAMTANAFDEDVQRSLQVGMNAHLSKPIEPEKLIQTLEELIWEAENKE